MMTTRDRRKAWVGYNERGRLTSRWLKDYHKPGMRSLPACRRCRFMRPCMPPPLMACAVEIYPDQLDGATFHPAWVKTCLLFEFREGS